MDERTADRVSQPTEQTKLQDTTTGDRDIDLRAILWFGGALVAAAIVVHVAMWLLSSFFRGEMAAGDPKQAPIMAETRREAAPAPRLQSDPNLDMAELRAEENAALETYAWLGTDKTTARIPVERAMEILLDPAHGLPKAVGGTPITPEERAMEGAGGPPVPSAEAPR